MARETARVWGPGVASTTCAVHQKWAEGNRHRGRGLEKLNLLWMGGESILVGHNYGFGLKKNFFFLKPNQKNTILIFFKCSFFFFFGRLFLKLRNAGKEILSWMLPGSWICIIGEYPVLTWRRVRLRWPVPVLKHIPECRGVICVFGFEPEAK